MEGEDEWGESNECRELGGREGGGGDKMRGMCEREREGKREEREERKLHLLV